MARTRIPLADVRVPTPRTRAAAIKAKLDEHDDYMDAKKVTNYAAAGAISTGDDVAIIDSATNPQVMTLAAGTVTGQSVTFLFRNANAAGAQVRIDGTFTGGTHLALTAAGKRAQVIWTGAAWTQKPGGDGVIS